MAWANDEGYERIFVEQLKNLASPGDVLVAISGSGNSPNIIRAVEWANANGLVTVGLTGFGGGKLKAMNHHNLHGAIDDMGIVESLHMVVFHWIIDDLNRRFAEPAAVAASARWTTSAPGHAQPSRSGCSSVVFRFRYSDGSTALAIPGMSARPPRNEFTRAALRFGLGDQIVVADLEDVDMPAAWRATREAAPDAGGTPA